MAVFLHLTIILHLGIPLFYALKVFRSVGNYLGLAFADPGLEEGAKYVDFKRKIIIPELSINTNNRIFIKVSISIHNDISTENS